MRANLDVIALLHRLREEGRAASDDDRRVLARWSSWGAVAALFDERADQWETERRHLQAVLDESAYAAARRTTINAHYTDPAYVQPMWDLLIRLGFTEGEVLEPGCGAGTPRAVAADRRADAGAVRRAGVRRCHAGQRRSLRAFLACGFVPVGSEVLLRPGRAVASAGGLF